MERDAIIQALRVLFVAGFPVIIVVSLVSTFVSVFQSATTVQESSLSYAVRVGALAAVLYFVVPGVVPMIVALLELALR